jgi:two-component system alkaline phosphatase synthesis response regulator PhoP
LANETILVVEDDRSMRDGLAMNLRIEGYTVETAPDGETGMKKAFGSGVDLLILDIMLPGWSGLEILQELRKRGSAVPVLILSARDAMPDKIEGLKLGADDYVTKPFELPELLARVEAMLRRRRLEQANEPTIEFGDLRVNPVSRSVTVGGQTTNVSSREFDLLLLLARSPGRVFRREDILSRVWGWDYDGTERTVDNFVVSLRKKIEPDPAKPRYIKTVRQVGYKFDDSA